MIKTDNDDDLLIAKILDKEKFCKNKNIITFSDFLNEREQSIIKKNIKLNNALFFGGNENSDRKVLFFYPDKLNEELALKSIYSILKVIRIILPNENKGEYEHRNYLSAIIKIGIDRAKVGDIIVSEDGADIVVFDTNKSFIIQSLSELTRFRKAKIFEVSINEIKPKEDSFEEKTIIVSSMRCDNLVSELANCSRNMASQMIEDERVLLNYETVLKASKGFEIGDVITIRGKGKFVIDKFDRSTRNNRIVLKIKKYI